MLGNSITLFSLQVFCSSETENEATASRQLDSLWSSKEVLIPICSKGKIAEAFRAFKKIYWGGGCQLVDHIGATKSNDSSRRGVKMCELF